MEVLVKFFGFFLKILVLKFQISWVLGGPWRVYKTPGGLYEEFPLGGTPQIFDGHELWPKTNKKVKE